MPWEHVNGDNISFSGPLADLMNMIMAAYEEDCPTGDIQAGVYVTAAAAVLREVLLENLENDPEAADFVEFISGTLKEDEDGTIRIMTFELLDETAEHIAPEALQHWLGLHQVRSAIIELSTDVFA